MFCSYGNVYRLISDKRYKRVILDVADLLATLFNPRVSTLLSCPRNMNHYSGHNTIMDNMINWGILFGVTKNDGKPYLFDIAVSYAEKTMKYHFRSDYTSYHVECMTG